MIILVIFGQISDLYFLTIFGKKSKKTAVKSDQNFFHKNPIFGKSQLWILFHFEPNNKVASFKWYVFQIHICSYLKQKKFFFFASPLSKKIKGGGYKLHQFQFDFRSPSGGKTHFFGQTEISGRWGGRGTKKSAGCEIGSHSMPLFKNFKFESKTKKLC